MKNGLTKLAAGIFASASALALSACSDTPDINAKCHIIFNGESASAIQVKSKADELMFVSQVTTPAKDGVITGTNTFRWNSEFPENGEPANTRELGSWIVADTKNNSCELQRNHKVQASFTGGLKLER